MIFISFIKKEIRKWIRENDSKYIHQCPKNIYIIKPGESTNRGNGINLSDDFEQISQMVGHREYHENGNLLTYIIQLYLDKPLLFYRRKFDIRCFVLMTSQNGIQKFYWYDEGYIRTSSAVYNLKDINDKFIHLTNDAI